MSKPNCLHWEHPTIPPSYRCHADKKNGSKDLDWVGVAREWAKGRHRWTHLQSRICQTISAQEYWSDEWLEGRQRRKRRKRKRPSRYSGWGFSHAIQPHNSAELMFCLLDSNHTVISKPASSPFKNENLRFFSLLLQKSQIRETIFLNLAVNELL